MRRLLGPACCVLRGGVAAGILALGSAAALPAQASPYLPLDDIGYAYIDALMARGGLRGLSMLERPYTVAELRRALDASDMDDGSVVIASWQESLRSVIGRFDPHAGNEDVDGALALRADVAALASARSSSSREVMLADTGGGAYPGAIGRAVAQGGLFAASLRVIADNALKHDPEYRGKKNRAVAGRVEDAYLAMEVPYVRLAAGRVARNLGPHALHGLQIGHYAFTYDHLFARLGTQRFHLSALVASLDPMQVGDSTANRYVALHRLSGTWGGLEVALTEAMLFGGPGRRFDPGYLNPINIYQLSQYNESGTGNVSFAVDVAWRTRSRGQFAAQLLVDDYQIDDCSPNCEEPSSLGFVASAEGVPLWGAQRLFASYARVSNLTYRTPAVYEQWTSYGVSLGHGRSDYDEATLGVDLALLPRLTIRPHFVVRRQGEGDYRAPFPVPADYAETPELHAGVVERTTRLGVRGSWMPFRGVIVQGDLGWNSRDDARHVEGASDSGLEGWARVTLESPWMFRQVLRPD